MPKFVDWIKEQSNIYYVGLVGYLSGKFDKIEARKIINDCFNVIEKSEDLGDMGEKKEIQLISGLTNSGIPKIGYEEAVKKHWKTIGLSAKEAEEYDCFPVDIKLIYGEQFGDESSKFINKIDCLIRVGGGPQSLKETNMAKQRMIPVYEFELERENDE